MKVNVCNVVLKYIIKSTIQFYINRKQNPEPKYYYDEKDPCYAYYLGKGNDNINKVSNMLINIFNSRMSALEDNKDMKDMLVKLKIEPSKRVNKMNEKNSYFKKFWRYTYANFINRWRWLYR